MNGQVGETTCLSAEKAKLDAYPKTTEFRYLLERKALRIMRRYYKEKFEKQFKYKSKMKDMTQQEMGHMVMVFVQ